jgi:hypothetical protein
MKSKGFKIRCPICFTRIVAPTLEIFETRVVRHQCRMTRDLRRLEPMLQVAVQLKTISVDDAWRIHDGQRAKS